MKEISWKRFGYHVVYDRDIFDAIDFASRHGFGYIVPDLMIPRFFPERFSTSKRRRIREVLQSEDVGISFHGPSDYLNVGSLYPDVRRAVMHRMKMCLDLARDVDAERFTIHVHSPFDFVFAGTKGNYLEKHWMIYKNAMRQGLLEIAEHAQDYIALCVENDRLSSMVMEVLEEILPTGKIFLTWDIPKTHNGRGEPIKEVENFLVRHLQEVKECHLHGQELGKPSHDMIGVGKIDFAHYLRILVPEDVYFTVEVRPREEALRSMKILKVKLRKIGWRISPSE